MNDNTARLTYCPLCHNQVLICRSCDRGQVYCGPICSGQARQESVKAAKSRYRNSPKGKSKNAANQRRHRERQRAIAQASKKVRDQGYHHDIEADLLSEPEIKAFSSEESVQCCHFCGKVCSPFLRYDFIQQHFRKVIEKSSWSQGP